MEYKNLLDFSEPEKDIELELFEALISYAYLTAGKIKGLKVEKGQPFKWPEDFTTEELLEAILEYKRG